MDGKMKLSICMIVKDEEKNIRRCLDSLKPLIEKPDVELIIVDTGSTDRTPEIAANYTSKLYFHKWENNFSVMRNISVSYAKGELIFILDADEVLMNPEHMYDVISDVNQVYFNTLIIKVRNLSETKGVYTILPQERIFRNDGEFRYEGSVHNQPIYKKPVFSTDIYIEHYGYMFKNKELSEKKFLRTSTLLKEELKKNPNSIYFRYQLAKSLDAHGDNREALNEIRIVHGLIQNEKAKRVFVYGNYAVICVRNHEYEEAVNVCKEGLEVQRDFVDLYYFMAESLHILGRNKEALEAYQKYIEYFEKYDDLPISTNRAIEMFSINESFKDVALMNIINELFMQCRYDEIRLYIPKLCDKQKSYEYMFLIHLKLKEFKALKELYDKQLDNRDTLTKYETTIEDEKSRLNCQDKIFLEELFSENENAYALLNRIRSAREENVEPLVGQLLKEFDLNDLPDFFADIFLPYEKSFQRIIPYMKRLQKRKIRGYTKILCDKGINFRDIFVDYLSNEVVRGNDFNGLKLYIGIAYVILFDEAGLIKNDLSDVPEQYSAIFEKYVENGFKNTALLYNQERLRLYYSTLEDVEDRFFIALEYARQAVEKSDYKSGIRYFSEALKANPLMACYMKNYKDRIFKFENLIEVD